MEELINNSIAEKNTSNAPAAVLIIVLLGVFATIIVFFGGGTVPQESKNSPIAGYSQFPIQGFASVEVAAKAAVVYDVLTREFIFTHNAESQLPLASLTKLLTVFIVSKNLPSYVQIAIDSEDIAVEGDSGLESGEKWNLKNLIDLTLVASSNDGAHALATAVETQQGGRDFLEIMNEEARLIGLSQTYFINESGLDNSEATAGGYGSARDVALLLETIVRQNSELLEGTQRPEFELYAENSEEPLFIENTNPLVGTIPGLIASKTGFTDLAGGNLVIVFDIGVGHPMVAVVLGSTAEERFSDVLTLVSSTIEYFGRL